MTVDQLTPWILSIAQSEFEARVRRDERPRYPLRDPDVLLARFTEKWKSSQGMHELVALNVPEQTLRVIVMTLVSWFDDPKAGELSPPKPLIKWASEDATALRENLEEIGEVPPWMEWMAKDARALETALRRLVPRGDLSRPRGAGNARQKWVLVLESELAQFTAKSARRRLIEMLCTEFLCPTKRRTVYDILKRGGLTGVPEENNP